MKRGRPSWTVKLSQPAIARLRVDVARGLSARELWAAHNLGRVTQFATFQTWVTRERRALAARGDQPGRWGTCGLRRFRRLGLAAVAGDARVEVAALALLDAAELVRVASDRLADAARGLFGAHGTGATQETKHASGEGGLE